MAAGSIVIDLLLKTGAFETDTKRAEKSLKGLKKQTDELKNSIKNLIGAFAIGATIKAVIDATAEQERVTAQLNATLKSTGRYTPELSKNLQSFASSLQSVTKFGDESIVEMQALLLTFTKIGGDNFNRAQRAILDVATAMGTDLKSAAIQVGKALNDPVKGIAALSRSGIQFTKDQEATIRRLVELGETAKAQEIILGELETQFGGSAEAARNTFGGAIEGLKNTFGDLLEGDADNGVLAATEAINDLSKTLSDPAIKEAFNTIVTGVIKITTAIANALPTITKFTKWAAEELAVRFGGGIAFDDLERIELRIDAINKRLLTIRDTKIVGPQADAEIKKLADELGGLLQMRDAYWASSGKKVDADGGAIPNVGVVSNTNVANAVDKVISKEKELANARAKAFAEYQKTVEFEQAIHDSEFAVKQENLKWYEEMDAAEKERQENLKAIERDMIDMLAPANQLLRELAKLDEYDGLIDPEILASRRMQLQAEIDKAIAGDLQETVKEMDEFAKNAVKSIQQSFADFLFDPFQSGLDGMLKGFGEMLKRMIAEAVAADIARRLFGDKAEGGSGGGLLGGALDFFSGLFSFAGGGYTGSGARSGGVDGMGGFPAILHPQESVIDHSRGQKVGGGGNTIIVNVNGSNNAPDVRRAAAQGAREGLGMLNAAQRYA